MTLAEEVRISSYIIIGGMRGLQDEYSYNKAIDIPLILLANGLERLLKCIVCFWLHHTTGSIPSLAHIKKNYGHDIRKLVSYVIDTCYSGIYRTRSHVSSELDYFRTDPIFLAVIQVLSDFGLRSRYANLDLILDAKSPPENPDDDWGRKIEREILRKSPEMLRLSTRNTKEFRRRASNQVIVALERFMYSIAHLMRIGGIGEYANTSAGPLRPFLNMSPMSFGHTVYDDLMKNQ